MWGISWELLPRGAGGRGCVIDSGLGQIWLYKPPDLWNLLQAFSQTRIPHSFDKCGCVLSCSQPIQKVHVFRRFFGLSGLVFNKLPSLKRCPLWLRPKVCPPFSGQEESNFIKWQRLKWGFGIGPQRRHMWTSDVADPSKFSFSSHRQKLQKLPLSNYFFVSDQPAKEFNFFSGSAAGPLLLVSIIAGLGFCLVSRKKGKVHKVTLVC